MDTDKVEETKEELVKNKTQTDTSISFDSSGRPEPLISLEDEKVNIKVFKITMSRKHRIVMVLDLWTIAWVSGIAVYMSMVEEFVKYRFAIIPIGIIVILCAIGKTITDFQNWLFTMNAMQAQMGDWYMDDVVGICQDLITAGTKVAAEEVSKAKEEKTHTEEDNGGGKSSSP